MLPDMIEQRNKRPYVNLGCGERYHPEWINIDFCPNTPEVIKYDLKKGIPLADKSCDVVYHSALLEHFRKQDAVLFMRECHRVLRPDGIIRVATPDLERICKIYLEKLEAVLKGDHKQKDDYDWILLEMYDQAVREQSGGEILAYLRQDPLPNESFIYERIGQEGRNIVFGLRNRSKTFFKQTPSSYLRRALCEIKNLRSVFQNQILKVLIGSYGMQALEIGRFRLSGEGHHWMYDRYSLAKLMCEVGFKYPIQQSAAKSQIPNWSRYNLDILSDGIIIKPDSFFMEAIKPGSE